VQRSLFRLTPNLEHRCALEHVTTRQCCERLFRIEHVSSITQEADVGLLDATTFSNPPFG
jgi:hypothetical protein